MSTYKTKITDYGYKQKITVYDNPITYNEPNDSSGCRKRYDDMSNEEKELSDKRRISYYKKAVKQLIEIALMNDDLNVAITLTFRDNVTSYDVALIEWQLFLKRLRHVYKGELKYICTWEYQRKRSQNLGITNGGIFHFHCLMNIGFIDHEVLERLWGQGFVWIDKLESNHKRESAIRYTTKYCVKEIVSRIENGEDVRGQRFYFTSNNLRKPSVTVLEHAVDLEAIIFEKMDDMIRDGEFVFTNEYDLPVNHVHYIEYKK